MKTLSRVLATAIYTNYHIHTFDKIMLIAKHNIKDKTFLHIWMALPTQLLTNDFTRHGLVGIQFPFPANVDCESRRSLDARHLAGSFKMPCLQRQEEKLGFPNDKAINQYRKKKNVKESYLSCQSSQGYYFWSLDFVEMGFPLGDH
jgi:hypothetical protein